MNIRGKWRVLAALAAALVLATGTGVSTANADHVDNGQVVSPFMCTDKGNLRPFGIEGTFLTLNAQNKSAKVPFNGCYHANANGEVLTSEGPLWIVDGSQHYATGYSNGLNDGRHDRTGVNKVYVNSTYYQERFAGTFEVDSQGLVRIDGQLRYVGLWSDWYMAGFQAGAAKGESERRGCFEWLNWQDTTPKTYGPETIYGFSKQAFVTHDRQVTVGFRQVAENIREPQVKGRFPWCVDVMRVDEPGPGWKLEVVFDDFRHIWGYDANGPYFEQWQWSSTGWNAGQRVYNETLWDMMAG